MTRFFPFRLATIGVLAAACLLTACGRKGPLDPPPGGWDLPTTPGMTPVSNRPAQPGFDEQGKPIAPTGPKRKTPADWLID